MAGPGQYVANATEGAIRLEDLPAPRVIERSRDYKRCRCPECDWRAYRLHTCERTLHDWGDPLGGRPRDLHLICSQHRCQDCGACFNADMDDLGLPKSHYTRRVVQTAVRLVVEDGLPYRAASWHLWRDHRVFVPLATIQSWVEAGGEKGPATRPD